ncbi:MAG TPA: hypothetical protein PKC14_03150 [Candidatus Absconditabacterales bacterium]|nr:hypothetical protein [Candidatus Absconditabacterales bacterium]
MGILLNSLLVLFVGSGFIELAGENKEISLFEKIRYSFLIGLSITVTSLFIEGLLFGRFFHILALIVTSVLRVIVLLKNKNILLRWRFESKNTVILIRELFIRLSLVKKIIIGIILIYLIVKIVISFQINTSMITYDEDAVIGRDMKTKVIYINDSLVLDKSNSEFFGTAADRNIVAPLIDISFLQYGSYQSIEGLTNIVSPIMYALFVLFLFGIFYKRDLFLAIIGMYLFTSIPFSFIHSFASYLNLFFGFIFFALVYMIYQYIVRRNSIFLWYSIGFAPLFMVRNEGLILAIVMLVTTIVFAYISRMSLKRDRKSRIALLISFFGFFIIQKILERFAPMKANSTESFLGTDSFSNIITSLGTKNIVLAPLQQIFFHSDFNIFYLVLAIGLCVYVVSRNREDTNKYLLYPIVIFTLMFMMFVTILFANVINLGLLSHFSFIRYGLVLVPLGVYILMEIIISYKDFFNSSVQE